jgi:hypothetical protein
MRDHDAAPDSAPSGKRAMPYNKTAHRSAAPRQEREHPERTAGPRGTGEQTDPDPSPDTPKQHPPAYGATPQ